MARCLFKAKLLLAPVADGISLSISRICCSSPSGRHISDCMHGENDLRLPGEGFWALLAGA
ncbi:hypothetical protein CUMW_019100 [Citrus unshiu]|nr:hypothetical protein CUMW_019100 [Citrus unshiu]